MSLFPAGGTLPLGGSQILDGKEPHIWVSTPDRVSQFYLNGPCAPFPGIPGQDGMVLKGGFRGQTPPFHHLDLQAAQQDGVTYCGTVYDPAEMTWPVEVHATTPQGVSAVESEWKGAWNPRQLLTLEYCTLDRGYWYSDVRLSKTWNDPVKTMPRETLQSELTHIMRIDGAFWKSVPSTDWFGVSFESFSDDFNTVHTTGLSSDWAQFYFEVVSGSISLESHTGVCASDGAQAYWKDNGGNETRKVLNIFTNTATDTDKQTASITLGQQWEQVTWEGTSANSIWLRLSDDGQNGIECRIGAVNVTVWKYIAGVASLIWIEPLIVPALHGETWTFVAGWRSDDPRSFAIQRGGITVAAFTEFSPLHPSNVGADYRFTGFGMDIVAGLFGPPEAKAVPVNRFAGGDFITEAQQSGFLTLSNIGTEDGYPFILCYGPGTFSFANGVGSTSMITLGPLYDGQIAMVTTLPRLRGVTDLSPGTPAATITVPNQKLQDLLNLAFNGNTPPLLTWAESLFGVLPPQGPLYSLLNGRFNNPVPGVSVPGMAKPQKLAVSISGGSPNSRIVGQIVPQRIWPE